MKKHTVLEDNAQKMWNWLHHRGGLAIWESVNLSNPGASWTTPALKEDGTPMTKPTWQVGNEPSRIITDPAEVEVSVPKEVRRFRVGVRMGDQGLSLKVTDGGIRKIRSAVARVQEETGKPTWYKFDYDTQEAVIMIDDKLIPMVEYAKSKGWEAK